MAKKKETQEKLKTVAKALFESNSELNEVFLCSNGQGFTDSEMAENYAKQFDDDTVYTFKREGEEESVANEKANYEGAFDYEKIDRELLDDRAFLFARYEALEGKKAPHNIGTEKLAERVQELEKERFSK